MSLRGENKRISNTVGSRKMSVISVFKPSLKEEQAIILCRKCQVSVQNPESQIQRKIRQTTDAGVALQSHKDLRSGAEVMKGEH